MAGWRHFPEVAALDEQYQSFSGLLFVKHGAVGTKSEGPVYFLQTATGDQVLKYQDRQRWEPDFHLEYYQRKMVEVQGTFAAADHILVKRIREICDPRIPPRPEYGSSAEQAALADKANATRLAGPEETTTEPLQTRQFQGLVYVKHTLIGTRSEGPGYFLQTARGDYHLAYEERSPWQRDDRLESYSRRMALVEGTVTSPGHLQVKRIGLLCEQRIPQQSGGKP